MSNLNAVRTELRRFDHRRETPGPRRLGTFAATGLVVLAFAVGLAEIHLLPRFSAEDFSSILFAAG